ncbi:Dihydrolipoamide acetyltransferase component of pyruvate dehydrogenase complex [Fasciola gigantica]|uniref:Dihydrolipoamide acetyltransferase component of pyruvate dehydrogenase complex n=1 Tax=Fasciola gigantica TaxID=46835 RepID=A0A504YEA7_FASGI|nr:Dihydrolipoamide acetyltransferase component of pyruvate dehydrogenase complex [Fasciola gigantica]
MVSHANRLINFDSRYVKVGDSVRQFDPLCEVQSDKATVTITSRYDGTIRALHFEPQDMCEVGQALVDIELVEGVSDTQKSSDSASSPATSPAEPKAPESDFTTHTEACGKALATPAVRRLAAENKINLVEVLGTGKDGRILKEDVLNFLSNRSSGVSPGTVSPKLAVSAPGPAPSAARLTVAPAGQDRVVQLSVIQRAMRTTMTQSNSIPHFVLSDELDLYKLVEFRKQTSDWVSRRYGLKLTYLPFFIKAASLALHEYPLLNAHTDEACEKIIYKASHNVGIAMDTPEGLLVPNIKSVEQLTVIQIAQELKRLQELGTKGKLGPDDLKDGTVTLSNIGSIGGTYTAPRILPPEVLIGGLGRMQPLPRFDEDGNVRVGHVLNTSWAADHRIIDGATVTRFSRLWASYLENPASLVFDLK